MTTLCPAGTGGSRGVGGLESLAQFFTMTEQWKGIGGDDYRSARPRDEEDGL
jgi:hypothetical protein